MKVMNAFLAEMFAVLRWLNLQWNNVIAPSVTDAVITGSGGDSRSQSKVASTALYVLMQRSVVPGCQLTGSGKTLIRVLIVVSEQSTKKRWK